MAIEIQADVDGATRPDDDARTEEVYLIDEGPYPFTYPPMGKLQAIELRVRGIKDKAEAEAIMTNTLLDWLERGFGKAAWERICERIGDDNDPLELPHLVSAYRGLIEAHAGRPTTSSNGASAQPWAKSATAVPSLKESDSQNSAPVMSAT